MGFQINLSERPEVRSSVRTRGGPQAPSLGGHKPAQVPTARRRCAFGKRVRTFAKPEGRGSLVRCDDDVARRTRRLELKQAARRQEQCLIVPNRVGMNIPSSAPGVLGLYVAMLSVDPEGVDG
eukprot:scaffold59026_cov48-Phaeocystis_antarctica.AAC.1